MIFKRETQREIFTSRLIFRAIGILLLLMAWELASRIHSGLVVASVLDTLWAGFKLSQDQSFLIQHCAVSLGRVAGALSFAVIIGVGLGMIAGLVPEIRTMLDPLRWMLMTVPGVVVVVVFMLWFGMGSVMVISIAATLAAPVIYINVADAMLLVDKKLLEVARVYNFGMIATLLKIYVMAVAGPFFSALVVAVGNIIRVVILAEVLGANEGIGHCLAIARTVLDTPQLYALALISMSIAGGLEFFLFRPMANKLVWKSI
ncbi:ABC transporter permease [Desulfogranum japonicum]|uniref:ABC transporter permease n=1 Tax=Desulfogranum japonicum TaxID=231447 RepID=UPI000415A7D7|nr:ABC transporter permease subunit [Desulfogranum japonicum]